jgi:MurNAc alpha-1-phosphate uridylyltransferase
MHAVILAAGRGERLRPLTDRTPKALIPIGGVPLAGRILSRLAQAGFRRAIINVCWLGSDIREALGNGRAYGIEIVYSPESVAQETAGGVRLALLRGLVESDPFLVHNADVLSDIAFSNLKLSPNDDACIALVPNPPARPEGDFACRAGRVRLTGEERWTYAGIGLYRKAFFEPLCVAPAPLRPLLEASAGQNRLAGYVHRGRWWDVGTPSVLAALEEAAAHGPLDGL